MKTKFISTLILVFCTLTIHGQSIEWAKKFEGTENVQGYYIAVDDSGNVYITGSFEGTADFDPGTGSYNLTSAGDNDAFISKIDASGNFVWAKQFSGSSYVSGESIALDDSGNIYITGYFEGTVNFEPGAGKYDLTSGGSSDGFISKFDTSGNFVWAKQFGGTSEVLANSTALDDDGNVYTTGFFSGTVDFDPDSASNFNLTSVGEDDGFISKLDASGDFLWAKQLGGTPEVFPTSIALDDSGNVYTTGLFKGTADFDPDTAGTYKLTSEDEYGGFISKLDPSGNFLWANKFEGSSPVFATSIALDDSGNVYTTGSFAGTVNFDPGEGSHNLISAAMDVFISKLDPSGNFVWAKQLSGTGFNAALSIAVDDDGNVYITGILEGTTDFDPGEGTYNLTSTSEEDGFISKLDASGKFAWAKQLGGTSEVFAGSTALDDDGNVYTTGFFSGTVDFDPDSASNYNLTSAGVKDVFILKISQ